MDPKPDYKHAVKAAKKVIRENNILRPPVIAAHLLDNYNLDLEYVELAPEHSQVCGYIDFPSRKISVNADDHFNRQNFTIAHELGHFMLHSEEFAKNPDEYQVLLRYPLGSDQVDKFEKEANVFATELLVPTDMLEMYSKYATVEDLASLFAVSREVIRYRMKIDWSRIIFY